MMALEQGRGLHHVWLLCWFGLVQASISLTHQVLLDKMFLLYFEFVYLFVCFVFLLNMTSEEI